ncbi:CHSTE-like protein [Mya arenaria]|uniref:Carbohydrate sulfotransferase n=1 Tax=Mya arenaria TaxID=6604 RepID=A0ABY7FDF2_MYAAR|nr:CHSTE-like protein [Mya arenaria]
MKVTEAKPAPDVNVPLYPSEKESQEICQQVHAQLTWRQGNSVSDEMAARKHKVNQECRGNLTSKYESIYRDELYKRLLVNNKKRIIFGALPKVANTNFRRIFLGIAGIVPKEKVFNISGYEVYNIHASKLNFLDQAPKKDRRRLLDKYKKFTFVRDPLSRLLSGYRNKFFHPNSVNREEFYNFVKTYYKLHHERKTMRKMRTNFIKGPITFKEFVTYILDCFETNDYVNEHFVPAYLLIQPCRVKYDYIGKFETIHTDTQHIFTELNIDISFPGRQDNYSSVATDTLVWSYYERLPVAMLKGLLDVFMPDFILFGYKVPDWIHDRIRNVTIH